MVTMLEKLFSGDGLQVMVSAADANDDNTRSDVM